MSTDEPTRNVKRLLASTIAPTKRGDELEAKWVDERFEITREIARGGMGRVLVARDHVLDRDVAVKQPLDASLANLISREAAITARLQHPSIIPLYDVGRDGNDTPFFIMRMIEGQPLSRLAHDAQDLDARLALVRRMMAAIHAIAYAHTRGVVHSDLKPGNILIGEHGDTVVIDWGLAIDGTSEVVDGVRGTPGFMAPEQARGETPDTRSDVYALGATLFDLLAGRPPHVAAETTEVVKAAASTPAPPLATVEPGVPRDLAAIVDKALSADRDGRYRDATELAADVARFLDGRLVAAHHYTPRQRLVRFVRRHRAPVAIGAVALVVTAVISTMAIAGIVTARDRAEAARALAASRADSLLLATARSVLDTDPTRAIALAASLPRRSPHARAIALEALRRGIASVRPTSSDAIRALAVAGDSVFTLGRDGTVERHTRERRELVGLTGIHAIAGVDDRLLVAGATSVSLVDPSGRIRTTWPAHDAYALLARDGWIGWIDDAGAHLRSETAAHDHAIANGHAHAVAAQVWAVASIDAIDVVDLASASTRSLAIDNGLRDVLLSEDGTRLAAVTTREIVAWSLAEPSQPPLRWPAAVGDRAAFLGRRLIKLAVDGTVVDLAGNFVLAHGEAGRGVPLAGLVASVGATSVTLVSERGPIRTLRGAPATLLHATYDRASHAIIAATSDRIVRWPLASTEARMLPVGGMQELYFASPRTLLGVASDGRIVEIDVTTGDVQARGAVAIAPIGVRLMRVGPTVVAHATITGVLEVVWPASRILENGVRVAVPFDGRLLVGTADGRVLAIEPATGRSHVYVTLDGPITSIGVSGSHLAASSATEVWRRDGDREARTRHSIGVTRISWGLDELLVAGAREATSGTQRWTIDGDVDAAAWTTGGWWVATTDRAIWKLGPRAERVLAPQASVGLGTKRIVYLDSSRRIAVLDPETNATWTLPLVLEPTGSWAIDVEGTRVAAVGRGHIWVWSEELPEVGWQEEVAKMTNARIRDPALPVVWE